MRPSLLAAVPVLVFGLGCMVDHEEHVGYALDYRIDRPRVLAIALDPPILLHGRQTTVQALALAPKGEEPDSVSVDVCGLKTDQVVDVREHDCFHNPDLVGSPGTELEFAL